MIKACIFDLDGTIADSLESIALSANLVIESLGFKKLPIENYKTYAGDGADELIRRALIAAGDTKLLFYEKAFGKYKEIFEKDCTYNVRLFDGISQMLTELKTKNIKIAILSNKPHNRTVDVIDKLFGSDYFDIVIGQSDERRKKPHPDGVLHIIKLFDIDAKECIYVGDTNTDMITGNSAGMYTIGVTWGFRTKEELEENGANEIIDSPKELLKYIN